jgi:transposase
MLTDGRGTPLSLVVAPAQRHDCKLFAPTVRAIQVRRPRPKPYHPQGMCLDAGYDYPFVRRLGRIYGFVLHLRRRGEALHDFCRALKVEARRWVVERTHSWFNRFRSILVRWSKTDASYLAFLHLAAGVITWRSTGLLE